MPNLIADPPAEMRLLLEASIVDQFALRDGQKHFMPWESFFLKVNLSATLELDFSADEKTDIPLLQVCLEFAYPDSSGTLVWRNTGAYRLGNQFVIESVPMIWDFATLRRKYLAAFTYHEGQDQVQVRCKTRHKNPEVPERTQLFTLDLIRDTEVKKTFGLIL